MHITLVNKNELLCRGVVSYVYDKFQVLPNVISDLRDVDQATDLMIYCGLREKQGLSKELKDLTQNTDILALIRAAYFKPKKEREFLNLGPIYPELIDGVMMPILEELKQSTKDLKKIKIIYPTKREKEVLAYMAQGKLNKEIAEALNISIETVKTHRKNLKRKLGLKSQLDYINYYKNLI